MSPTYAAARIPQIDLMLRRLTEAKTEDLRRSLINPLSGRSLGDLGALVALRRNNEINDTIERLTDEWKTLDNYRYADVNKTMG